MDKKITVALSIIFTASFNANCTEPDWRDTCKTYSEVAEVVMQYRQKGDPISKLMDIAKDDGIMEKLIIMAYDSPRFRTPHMQQSAIDNFRNDTYLDCAKAFRSQTTAKP